MSGYEALPEPKRSNVTKVLHWGDSPAHIRCLIGNTRYRTEFQGAARAFTLAGEIVLTPDVYADNNGMDPKEQELLHDLTLKRIDMADMVYVINPNNRITETVQKQIDYAVSRGRVVTYLESPAPK